MGKLNEKFLGLGFVQVITLSLVLGVVMMPTVAIPPLPPETPPGIVLAVDPSEIVADGSSTAVITATIWDGEFWIWFGPYVNFSTDLGAITPPVPLVNGTAAATLTAGTVEGIATITVEANVSGIGLLTNTTTVNFTVPGGTPTPSGGNGGNGPSSSGSNGVTTTTPTPTVTTSPGVTPTPISTATATPGTTAGAATPTPAVTAGTTPGPTATPASATPTPKEPGFGAGFAIAGLLAVAYLLMGRRNG